MASATGLAGHCCGRAGESGAAAGGRRGGVRSACHDAVVAGRAAAGGPAVPPVHNVRAGRGGWVTGATSTSDMRLTIKVIVSSCSPAQCGPRHSARRERSISGRSRNASPCCPHRRRPGDLRRVARRSLASVGEPDGQGRLDPAGGPTSSGRRRPRPGHCDRPAVERRPYRTVTIWSRERRYGQGRGAGVSSRSRSPRRRSCPRPAAATSSGRECPPPRGAGRA